MTTSPRRLYRLGAFAALFAAGFALLQVAIEVVALMTVGQPPLDVEGWFEMLRAHPLIGATELTVFQIPLFVLLIPVFAALSAATSEDDIGVGSVIFVTAIVGIAVYLATNPVLALISLSKDYASATAAERSTLIAAGRAMFGAATISIDVGASVLAVAWFTLSARMFRSRRFTRGGALTGLLATATQLLATAVDVLTTLPNILLLEIAGAAMIVFLLVSGRDLRRLGAQGPA